MCAVAGSDAAGGPLLGTRRTQRYAVRMRLAVSFWVVQSSRSLEAVGCANAARKSVSGNISVRMFCSNDAPPAASPTGVLPQNKAATQAATPADCWSAAELPRSASGSYEESAGTTAWSNWVACWSAGAEELIDGSDTPYCEEKPFSTASRSRLAGG